MSHSPQISATSNDGARNRVTLVSDVTTKTCIAAYKDTVIILTVSL